MCAFIQNYISEISDEFLKIISEEINVKGTIYDNKEAYLDSKNKHS